jgi:hypothetical protein
MSSSLKFDPSVLTSACGIANNVLYDCSCDCSMSLPNNKESQIGGDSIVMSDGASSIKEGSVICSARGIGR